MKHYISSSKYMIPTLPEITDRPRLFDLLDEGGGKRINFIVGQAAQGKTTLVTSYLSRHEHPTAWMHLDAGDSDHSNFFYLLAYSLENALDGFSASEYLTPPQITLGPEEALLRNREKMAGLLESVSVPVNLVIDGLEVLKDNSPSFELIQMLMDTAPRTVRLFIISREIPPAGARRYLMNREAMMLGNNDLAFTGDEIADYLTRARNMDVESDIFLKILEITEGWAGGLILLSESLQRMTRDRRSKFIFEEMTALMPEDTLEYFFEEIFRELPEALQSFLMRTSVFDEIEPSKLSRISGMENIRILVEVLEKRNLFIHAVKRVGKGRIYRYHQLFRDFLRSMLIKEMGDLELSGLLTLAGDVYRDSDELEEAVKYYLRGHSYEKAMVVIKKIGLRLIICGRSGELSAWLLEFPEYYIEDNPWLLLYLTMTRRVSGGRRNVEDFQKALMLFREARDLRGELLSLAYLIEAGVFTGCSPTELRGWLDQGEDILGKLSGTEKYVYARTVLWQHLGFGHIAGGHDLRKGISACGNAYLLASKIEDVTLQVNAMIVSALGYTCSGEFEAAEAGLSKIAPLVKESGYPEYRTLQSIVNISLALGRGDLSQSGELLETCREDIEKFGLTFLYPGFVNLLGQHQVYSGSFDEAEQTALHLQDVALLSSNLYYSGLAGRLQAMTAYFKGDFSRAETLCVQAESDLFGCDRDNIYGHMMRGMLGMVCLMNGELENSEELLLDSLSFFTRIQGYLSMAELNLSMGLLCCARKDMCSAENYFRAGFELINTRKYDHMPMLRPESFTRACLLAAVLVPEALGGIGFIVSSRLARYVGEEARQILSEGVLGKKKAVKDVLGTIYRKTLPVLNVKTLGEFRVECGEENCFERDAVGSKPVQMLKAIIGFGSRDIQKDVLIEALWPESSAESGEKNFKVNLHRLRKAIEPEGAFNKLFGNSYVHLKHNVVSLDKSLFRIDVDEFEKFLSKAEKQESVDDKLKYYEGAESLYGGEFLSEELYAVWAESRRMSCGERYFHLLGVLSEIHGDRGDMEKAVLCYQQMIKADSCYEPAYRKLMMYYGDAGKKGRALAVYEQCREALGKDLDMEPEPLTTELFQKILNPEMS